MFCTSCGKRNEDANRFCEYCGAPLDPAMTVSPPTAPSFTERICKIGHSWLVLVPAILISIRAVFSLISISSFTAIIEKIEDMLIRSEALVEIPEEVYRFIDEYSSSINFGYLAAQGIGSSVMIFLAVGLWVLYASCSGKIRSRGATLCLRIHTGLRIVALAIASAAFVALSILAGISSVGVNLINSELGEGFGIVLLIMIPVFLLVLALLILDIVYYAKLGKTLREVNDAAVRNVSCKISAFVPAFMIISGIGRSISNTCVGLSCILLAVALLKLREALK